ncbi:MAG TPA: response regulator, partial [Thermomonas sp.]|nr:response regulator [Thermomonas sp.]
MDDDTSVARTIGFVAEAAGFSVHCVDAPGPFFEAVGRLDPSHIAIDLIMPGMDGVEVLRQLALAGCEAGVILTSGMGQKVLESAQATASERGLNIVGVLPKPFR